MRRARIAVGNGTETFEEDPRGNVTLCTGAVPVYEPPDYSTKRLHLGAAQQPEIKRPEVSSPAPVPQPTLPGGSSRPPKVAQTSTVSTLWCERNRIV